MTFIKLSKELILNLITLVVVTFLSFWINAHKLWDIQQIVFYIDSRYLIEHITSIGGTSEWITNLIGQFFFFRIMGNLI
ncbi:MAG: DUF6057 family protein, partial [Bacteroidales bacterium]|nr:DUF6057 family protein [Bacteroidales bacterium]